MQSLRAKVVKSEINENDQGLHLFIFNELLDDESDMLFKWMTLKDAKQLFFEKLEKNKGENGSLILAMIPLSGSGEIYNGSDVDVSGDVKLIEFTYYNN